VRSGPNFAREKRGGRGKERDSVVKDFRKGGRNPHRLQGGKEGGGSIFSPQAQAAWLRAVRPKKGGKRKGEGKPTALATSLILEKEVGSTSTV